MSLDLVFNSLSNATRRDILKRVAREELSVGEIASHYDLTFAAVSKHLMVLEKANLICKRRKGKEQLVSLAPGGLADAAGYMRFYQEFWDESLDSLGKFLEDKEQVT